MSTRPWVLTIGLQTVRAEFNVVFPKRSKKTDGSVGDTAHMQGTSGHDPEDSGHAEYNDHDSLNEVRAIDVTTELNDASGNGVKMETVIQYLVTRGRAGYYLPFRYFIFNKRIWRKATGWKTEAYHGSDPHTGHAHFSGDYTQTGDNWKGSLGLASLTKRKVVPVNVDDLVKNKNAGKTGAVAPDTILGGLTLSQQVLDGTDGNKLEKFYIAFANLGKLVVEQGKTIVALQEDLASQDAKLDQIIAALPSKV